MSGFHWPISPSSLALTVACQAHISLSKGLPREPDGQEAMEGNAADWVRKEYAANRPVPVGATIPTAGNFKVDHDMIQGAKLWVSEAGTGGIYGVPIQCRAVHPTACGGEPDNWTWDVVRRRLIMRDYKYGFGIVEVMWFDEDGCLLVNWQELPYTFGVLEDLGFDVWREDIEIEFVIVQPRAFHKDGPIRRYVTSTQKVLAQLSVAKGAAARALGESGPISARTGSHCRECPARLVCETYQKETSRVVEYVARADTLVQDPHSIGVELAILQKYFKMLEGRITALETAAEALLRKGGSVTGFCLEPGQSRLIWMNGVTFEELEQMGATCKKPKNFFRKPDKDINSKNSTVLTPTQAKNAGIDEAVINQYAHRPTPAMRLARRTDQQLMKIFGVQPSEQ